MGATVDHQDMIAGRPTVPIEVPTAVRAQAAGRPVDAVWRNLSGGLTFRLGDGADAEFMKLSARCSGVDLAAEVRRLRWAGQYATVPRVLRTGHDAAGAWLITRALVGESAVHERWRADPARAAWAVGVGLRRLHEALPVARCPFSWAAQLRLARARAADRRRGPETGRAGRRERADEGVWARLEQAPPVDRLVVCHGDACVPNTLIGDDGAPSGHVDLGSLGVADRWADLAVATWSTEWNYGPGFEQPLLEGYGIDPDPVRTEYYRRLWDAGD